jgi:hypothetical protein
MGRVLFISVGIFIKIMKYQYLELIIIISSRRDDDLKVRIFCFLVLVYIHNPLNPFWGLASNSRRPNRYNVIYVFYVVLSRFILVVLSLILACSSSHNVLWRKSEDC